MTIDDELAVKYIQGMDISCYKERWYYTKSDIEGYQGKNLFTMPSYEKEHQNKVKIVCDAIRKVSSNFLPTNVQIWNQIFPDWESILSQITIDVIVGYPEPFDATVLKDPEGRYHVIFDAGLWTAYLGQTDISSIVQNLLTHELFHVLTGLHFSNMDEDIESEDYVTNLDANTFNEAFAHLVSYNATEIDLADWHSKKLEEVRKASSARMLSALSETDKEARSKNLYEAVCGNYYGKYACMCGMLYLVRVWEKGGIKALSDCFNEGYHEFAKKAAEGIS